MRYINTYLWLACSQAADLQGYRLDALRRDYIEVLTMLGLRGAVPRPMRNTEELLNG